MLDLVSFLIVLLNLEFIFENHIYDDVRMYVRTYVHIYV